MDTPESHPTLPAHALTCMEIFGGNEPIDTAISTPGVDAFIFSRPYAGEHAGGDIHYASMCVTGRIARFMVADVSGHGEVVAEVARTLRGLMRKNINTLDNARFTRALNTAFQMDTTGGKFATAILASYFAPTDELIVVNAGHPRPLRFDAERGAWSILTEAGQEGKSAANLPLGIIDPTEFSQFSTRLNRGDLVLFYTDGLIEASSAGGQMLGEEGLIRLVSSLDRGAPERMIPQLLARIEAHQGGKPIGDDVTCVLLCHNASNPPKYSLGEQMTALAKAIGLRPV